MTRKFEEPIGGDNKIDGLGVGGFLVLGALHDVAAFAQ